MGFKKAVSPITESNINNTTQLSLCPSAIKRLLQEATKDQQAHIPFYYIDYLELVDWTGRIVRENKRGYTQQAAQPILERLAVDNEEWLLTSNQFEEIFNKRFNQRPPKPTQARNPQLTNSAKR